MASKNSHSYLREVIRLADLAALTMLSERQIQRLTAQGIFRRARNRQGQSMNGRYVLGEAIPAYIEHLRTSIEGDALETAYQKARARRMRAAAEGMELELQVKKGKLHRQDDIEFCLSLMLRSFRDRCLAIPSRVMRSLIGLTNSREANRIVGAEIEIALNELSNLSFDNSKKQRETCLAG
jgi:phage terminase Nu1 subunit (DNA packaging protein)